MLGAHCEREKTKVIMSLLLLEKSPDGIIHLIVLFETEDLVASTMRIDQSTYFIIK